MPILAFTSPKGGVGKTTVSAHVAAILQRRGHDVLAIDLDPQNALRLHLGLSMREEAGFLGRIDEAPDWRAISIPTPCGVKLLPFGAAGPGGALRIGRYLLDRPDALTCHLHSMLAQPGLIVVLDTPPGPSAALEAALPLIDVFCTVLLADAGSATLIPQVAQGLMFGTGTFARRYAGRVGLVMNQVDLTQPLSEAVMECATRGLGHRLLGAICKDAALSAALAHKRLLVDGKAGAAEDLQLIADSILSRLPLPNSRHEAVAFPALAEWGLR